MKPAESDAEARSVAWLLLTLALAAILACCGLCLFAWGVYLGQPDSLTNP